MHPRTTKVFDLSNRNVRPGHNRFTPELNWQFTPSTKNMAGTPVLGIRILGLKKTIGGCEFLILVVLLCLRLKRLVYSRIVYSFCAGIDAVVIFTVFDRVCADTDSVTSTHSLSVVISAAVVDFLSVTGGAASSSGVHSFASV